MAKAIYQLEHLTCPSCITKIESTLSEVEGLIYTKVLFNSRKVKTEFNENIIQENTIEGIILRLGYPVTSVKVTKYNGR